MHNLASSVLVKGFYYLPFSLKLLIVYEWSYDFFLVDKKNVIT